MRKTLQSVITTYGTTALVVYLALFALVLAGFAVAFWLGWRPAGAGSRLGVLTAAYVATKLTQPLRIIATAALTPLCARLFQRLRPRPGPDGGTT
jgi:hypothetical protein